jgi:hypothetical protein
MKKQILNFMREFVSNEKRNYRMQIGSTLASSLAGVVCGAVMASIIWYIAFQYTIETLLAR